MAFVLLLIKEKEIYLRNKLYILTVEMIIFVYEAVSQTNTYLDA